MPVFRETLTAQALAVNAAQKEVDRMAGVVVNMLDKVMRAFRTGKNDLPDLLESIRNDEKTTDILELRINEYLAALTHTQLSTATNSEVLSLLSMINDLERIGDHGEKLSILMEHLRDRDYGFSPDAVRELEEMCTKTISVVRSMRSAILVKDGDPMPSARENEDQLNKMRGRLRESHLARLSKSKCSPVSGIVFTDMLTSFEKMGDHAFNVVEATVGIK